MRLSPDCDSRSTGSLYNASLVGGRIGAARTRFCSHVNRGAAIAQALPASRKSLGPQFHQLLRGLSHHLLLGLVRLNDLRRPAPTRATN
jgi:hypothetical protein